MFNWVDIEVDCPFCGCKVTGFQTKDQDDLDLRTVPFDPDGECYSDCYSDECSGPRWFHHRPSWKLEKEAMSNSTSIEHLHGLWTAYRVIHSLTPFEQDSP